MPDSDEENSIFEINDFTIVTPIEECSAAIENLIQKWGLYGRRPIHSATNWLTTTKDVCTIQFGGNKLKIEYVHPVSKNDEMKIENDGSREESHDTVLIEEHQNTPFSLVEDLRNFKSGFDQKFGIMLEFGVREYIYLTPMDDSSHQISSETECDTIIGAIKLALHGSGCEVPVFVISKDVNQQIKHGYATDGIATYNFSTVSLRNLSKKHCFLNGLISIFKEHVNVPIMPNDEEIRITTRFHNYAEIKSDRFFRTPNARKLQMVPFGTYHNLPINVVCVVANWKDFREDVMTENETHSDFDINFAANWCVSLEQVDDGDKNLILTTALKQYAKKSDLKMGDKTAKEALGSFYTPQGTSAAFDKLTGSNSMEIKIGSPTTETACEISGPLPPRFVSSWVSTIFGNVEEEKLFNDELKNMFSLQNKSMRDSLEHNMDIEDLLYPDHHQNTINTSYYKAARQPSLAWKLAIAMLNVHVFENNTPKSEPQLWLAFVNRLREKYENNEDIDVHDPWGEIDTNQCYLVQKLQLLQSCVLARRKRYALYENAADVNHDEFFDAEDEFREGMENLNLNAGNAQGRLKRCDNLKLLNNPNVPLYIPITQDRSPATEDMEQELADYLISLNDEERVLAQLEPLQSDMMSFKAANPGCVFEDFLRWHSPKDFDEDAGIASERMITPGNAWLKCWDATRPLAVINQARLFNDTKLAEEVFELFENAKMDKIRQWLKPIVFVVAFQRVVRVINEEKIHNPKLVLEGNDAMQLLATATKFNNESKYKEIYNWITQTEIRLNLSIHLLSLFNLARTKVFQPHASMEATRDIIIKLVDNWWKKTQNAENVKDVVVKPQDPLGRAISAICDFENQEDKRARYPEKKEYIFNWNVKRPSQSEFKLPQRMYASLEEDFNQICISLGQDCNFNNTIMD